MAPRDTEPSWVRVGDEVRADGPYGFGRPVDLVELPFDWALDDWPYFAHDPGGPQAGLRSPRDVEAAWADEFDYLYDRVGRGVFVLTMHPQCIGRGGRLLMLERLVAHFAERPGVRFVTMAEAADAFRRENPLMPA